MKMQNIIIVGAGVAGLTLACLLSRDGHTVSLVEKESAVGGLARSFTYDDFIFDIGPHRFHTDYQEVIDFIEEILEDDCRSIVRRSGVWMFDRYFEWPLTFRSLFGMPFGVLLSAGKDLLKKSKGGDESFEDYILQKYGKTLYEIFFKPYTEKFVKVPCSRISRDWAVTGIDRAVIDRKIQMDNLAGLARSLVFSRPPIEFLYPRSGGIQVFSDKLRQRIEESGGSVFLNAVVHEVKTQETRVTAVEINDQMHPCDLLVWTGPITEIVHMLTNVKIELEYLALLLYNYRVDHDPLIDYQWCYYGARDVPFNRISIPSLFNPASAPSGKSGLCVEVTCKKGDNLWNGPDALETDIRTSLVRTGVIQEESAVLDWHVERIPNTYPVYVIDYREKQRKAYEFFDRYDNVKLLGRTGSFWYNNMDHSMHAAMRLYDDIKDDSY